MDTMPSGRVQFGTCGGDSSRVRYAYINEAGSIHAIDYLRGTMLYGGGILILAGLYLWYTRSEPAKPNDGESERRTYGDSITDVRTAQAPNLGLRMHSD